MFFFFYIRRDNIIYNLVQFSVLFTKFLEGIPSFLRLNGKNISITSYMMNNMASNVTSHTKENYNVWKKWNTAEEANWQVWVQAFCKSHIISFSTVSINLPFSEIYEYMFHRSLWQFLINRPWQLHTCSRCCFCLVQHRGTWSHWNYGIWNNTT